jgi:hypothetical protein
MRIGTRLARAQFTLFPRFSAAGGTTNRQGLFPFDYHSHIMRCRAANKMFNFDQFINFAGFLRRFSLSEFANGRIPGGLRRAIGGLWKLSRLPGSLIREGFCTSLSIWSS